MSETVGRRELPPLPYYAKVTAVVIAVVVSAVALYEIRSVALSVFLGLFLAIAAEPFLSWLERRGLSRGWAVTVLSLGTLVVLAGMVTLLVYPAVQQIGQLIESLPNLLNQLTASLDRFGVRFDDPAIRERLEGIAEKLPSLLGSSLGAVYGVLGGVVSAIFTAFTVIALALYFMLWLPRIRRFVGRALGDPERVEVMDRSLARIGGYVTGQLTVSLVAGVVSGVVLGLLGVPYAAVLGVAMALFSAIPQIGATIGAVVCTLVALTDSLALGLITLAFLVAYQQFENYVLAPRVFSSAVDLSPVAVFIAVLVGGSALGVIGALTALPVAAAMKVVFRYVFRERLRRIETDDEAVVADTRPGPAEQGVAGPGRAAGPVPAPAVDGGTAPEPEPGIAPA
ncbi:MAG TPA: AI-2E family transporter [Pseudonocardiaceae bacterium]